MAGRPSTHRRRRLKGCSAHGLWLHTLPEDLLERITLDLMHPLRPASLVALASCCHAMHAALTLPMRRLRKKRCEALVVLSKAGCSIDELLQSRRLIWNNCGLTDADCEQLAALLENETLPLLRRLSLSGNCIGDAGCAALTRASRALPELKGLVLSKNRIGDTGCLQLIEALSCGMLMQLDTLNLEDNQIGAAGLRALARTIDGSDVAALHDGFLYLRGNPGRLCHLTWLAIYLACRKRGIGGTYSHYA